MSLYNTVTQQCDTHHSPACLARPHFAKLNVRSCLKMLFGAMGVPELSLWQPPTCHWRVAPKEAPGMCAAPGPPGVLWRRKEPALAQRGRL